jgi:Zn-finger nucleic acid-binding protein
MVCEQCGATVEVAAAFPGARVRCACGAEGRVPDLPAARSGSASLYRVPASRPTETAAVGPAGPRCPRCSSVLTAQAPSLEGEGAYACDACWGAFLETGAIERLCRERASPLPYDLTRRPPPRTPSTERYVRCPRCHEVMNRLVFGARSGVVVDACAGHGVWFDRGELERAMRFVAEGGLEKAGGRPPAGVLHSREAADMLARAEGEREPAPGGASPLLLSAVVEALVEGLLFWL